MNFTSLLTSVLSFYKCEVEYGFFSSFSLLCTCLTSLVWEGLPFQKLVAMIQFPYMLKSIQDNLELK